MWLIDAQRRTSEYDRFGNFWTGSIQIPTFFLDERVQGIVDTDHAKRIAYDILNPTNDPMIQLSIHAEKVE